MADTVDDVPQLKRPAFTIDEKWLGLDGEDALEPDLEIVDPHHHLWDHRNVATYLVPDLHRDTGSGHNVVQTVFVECDWAHRSEGPLELRSVGETERVAACAAETRRADRQAVISGIVSTCDLRRDDVAAILDAHAAAGDGLFRGIRHRLAHDPTGSAQSIRPVGTPPGLAGDPDFRRGVRALGDAGYTFDAWLYHPQVAELTLLAQATPGTTIILDHIGGPIGVGAYTGKTEEVRAHLRHGLADLARCPNVVVKVGGIGMVVYGAQFEAQPVPPSSADLVAEWGDEMRFVIDTFGPDRCMFESNFPVDKQSCSYRTLWNAFKLVSQGYSPAERAALFAGTARRVYRLDPVSPSVQ